MKRIIPLILAVLLILSVGLAGCGSEKETPRETTAAGNSESVEKETTTEAVTTEKKEPAAIRFSWWGEQIRHNATMEAVKIFQTKNPHITVEVEFSGWDGYYQKLTTQVATNTAPDVFQCGNVAEFIAITRDGSAEDLQPYIDKGLIELSDVSPSVIDKSSIEGKLYSIMPGTSSTGIAVNMDLLEKAGASLPPEVYTIDDLYALLKQVHDKIGVYGIKTWKPDAMMGLYYGSKGLTEYTQEGRLSYDEALLTKCFEDALKWQEEGLTPTLDQEYQTMAFEDSPFVSNKCLMQVVGSGQFNVIDELTETEKPLGYIPLPHVDVSTTLEGNGVMYAISSSSKFKEASAALINFLINDIEGGQVLGFTRAVPISAKVRESLNGKLSETDNISLGLMNVVSKYAKTIIDPVKPTYAAYVNKYLKDAQEEVLFKSMTPAEAAKDFFEKVNKVAEEALKKQ